MGSLRVRLHPKQAQFGVTSHFRQTTWGKLPRAPAESPLLGEDWLPPLSEVHQAVLWHSGGDRAIASQWLFSRYSTRLLYFCTPHEEIHMRTTDHQYRRAVGLFSTRQEAEGALQRLRDSGFNMDRVSVVAQHSEGMQNIAGAEVNKDKGDQAKGGAGAGATAGAVTGGAIGLVGSLGVLAIPGIGPAAEVGFLLANTLLGSGIGAAGGGFLGALIGWGVPEDRAQYYNDRVYNDNDYLVLVEGSDQDISAAEAVLQRHGIRDWGIYSSSEAPTYSRSR